MEPPEARELRDLREENIELKRSGGRPVFGRGDVARDDLASVRQEPKRKIDGG